MKDYQKELVVMILQLNCPDQSEEEIRQGLDDYLNNLWWFV